MAEQSQNQAVEIGAPEKTPQIYQEGVAQLEAAQAAVSQDQVQQAVSLAQQSQTTFQLALKTVSEQPEESSAPPPEFKKPEPPAPKTTEKELAAKEAQRKKELAALEAKKNKNSQLRKPRKKKRPLKKLKGKKN